MGLSTVITSDCGAVLTPDFKMKLLLGLNFHMVLLGIYNASLGRYKVQSKNIIIFRALFCLVMVGTNQFYPYFAGLLYKHWVIFTDVPVPRNQPWRAWIECIYSKWCTPRLSIRQSWLSNGPRRYIYIYIYIYACVKQIKTWYLCICIDYDLMLYPNLNKHHDQMKYQSTTSCYFCQCQRHILVTSMS